MDIIVFESSSLIFDRLAALLSLDGGTRRLYRAADPEGVERLLQAVVPDAMVIDIDSATLKRAGISVLEMVKEKAPHAAAIILCEYPWKQYKVQCARLGAEYFLDKTEELDMLADILEYIEQGKKVERTKIRDWSTNEHGRQQ